MMERGGRAVRGAGARRCRSRRRRIADLLDADRPAAHRRRSHRSALLGAPPARDRALLARRARGARADGRIRVFIEARPAQHAGHAGAPACVDASARCPRFACWRTAPSRSRASWRLAAGRLWTLGARRRTLAALDRPQRKLRLQLPTYPFERKRFWIDVATSPVGRRQLHRLLPPSRPMPRFRFATPAVDPRPSAASAARRFRPARSPRLTRARGCATLFEESPGIDMSDVEGAAPFVELGLDSLTLTQAAIQVKKHFKVNLTFRQLMESYRSFDALAEYLDATLPPDPVAAPVAMPGAGLAAAPQQAVAAMAVPVAMPMTLPVAGAAAANGTLVQQVIAQQMQLMQQQLALLSAAPTVPASPVLPAAGGGATHAHGHRRGHGVHIPRQRLRKTRRRCRSTTSRKRSARSRASTRRARSRRSGRRRGWQPSCAATSSARAAARPSPNSIARTWPTRAW